MELPGDPYILFSYLNTELRDSGETFSEFCLENALDAREITQKLRAAGAFYDEAQNQFRLAPRT